MTRRPSSPQGDLLAGNNPDKIIVDELEDPKANSPDDLGFGRHRRERPPGVDDRPPAEKSFGDPSPGPDPVPVNVCSSAIGIEDARKFVTWIHDQDLSIHEDVTVGHVLVSMSGWGSDALGWLCRACRQAGRAPAPSVMREAWKAKDVGLLRPSDEPEKTEVARQN